MENKYKLTDETMKLFGHTLHKIEAVRSFGCVRKGDKGGWVEKEDNLSHDGDCWVSGDAMVYGNAVVYDNAKVFGNARVSANARVFDNAMVYGHARAYGNASVSGNARVDGNAIVCCNAWVYGNAYVYDNTEVSGEARICGDAAVNGKAQVFGDAKICSQEDYCVIKNFWSSGRYFTYTRSNKMWAVGCFHGTGEELIKKAYDEDEEKGKCYEMAVKFVEGVENIL